jgi:hypothetical protein
MQAGEASHSIVGGPGRDREAMNRRSLNLGRRDDAQRLTVKQSMETTSPERTLTLFRPA